jgi:hypothetical protein
VAWLVDESDGRAMRLPAGPVDDDNRWGCCRHCGCQAMYIKLHDEPCMDCQGRPEED